MITLSLVVLGSVAFALLDAFQRRYLPSLYMEPLDLTYGTDRDLAPRRVLIRFGFPFIVGLAVGIAAWALNAEAYPNSIAGAATGLGSLMLVYPFLVGRLYPPRYAVDRRNAATITYLVFVLLNAGIGYFASTVSQSMIHIFRGPEIVQAVSQWARQELLNVVLTACVSGRCDLEARGSSTGGLTNVRIGDTGNGRSFACAVGGAGVFRSGDLWPTGRPTAQSMDCSRELVTRSSSGGSGGGLSRGALSPTLVLANGRGQRHVTSLRSHSTLWSLATRL